MIDNIESTRIQEISSNSPIRQSDFAKIPLDDDIDVSLKISYAYIINRATQIPETDNNSVQEACELLKSGRLENNASTRAAAEKMIELGI
jgi:hypothetical protein